MFGHHRTHMGVLERGEENLSLQKHERLAERLEVHPLELLKKPSES